jgi:hypothetical protein
VKDGRAASGGCAIKTIDTRRAARTFAVYIPSSA